MNRESLKILLEENKVPSDQYSLKGGLPNESYCLEKLEDGTWSTYYSERGGKSGIKVFLSEDDACESLLQLLLPRS